MKKKAYGKINFGIRIINKRKDGYHNLEMIMTKIDLYDDLYFKKSKKIEVICDGVNQNDNLVYKVALYLKEKYNVKSGVKIIVKKRIPIQAGLGGGSSDAATTIRALNKIWRLNLSDRTIFRISNMFGSDVPFFISTEAGFVYGKGDNIDNFKIKKTMPMLLVKPEFGFSTKSVFNKVKQYSRRGTLEVLKRELILGNTISACKEMVNDLEKALLLEEKFKEIELIKEQMYKLGSIKALMSGSGSSVFAVFENKKERNLAYKKMSNGKYAIYKIKNI